MCHEKQNKGYRIFVPTETDIIALIIIKVPGELLSDRTNIC